MRLVKTLTIGLGIATLGATAALSMSAIAQGKQSTPQVANQAGNKQQAFGKDDINELCTSEDVSVPEPGMHFDGSAADTAVLALVPGRYDYPNEGAMLFFTDGRFLLKLPEDGRENTNGTDGSDLLAVGGIVGGCFVEQLSEAIANNNLDVSAFELVSAYE